MQATVTINLNGPITGGGITFRGTGVLVVRRRGGFSFFIR